MVVPTVYFARAGQDGPIKIGFTRKSPLERISELQTGCPWRISLIGSLAGQKCHEDWLHDRFDASRLEGEWFLATPELLAVVADTAMASFAWPDELIANKNKPSATPLPEPKFQTPKQRAVKAVGGAAELARGLGVTRSAVQQWVRVPAVRVLEVTRLTGVPRHELRPDVYPAPKPDALISNQSVGA